MEVRVAAQVVSRAWMRRWGNLGFIFCWRWDWGNLDGGGGEESSRMEALGPDILECFVFD